MLRTAYRHFLSQQATKAGRDGGGCSIRHTRITDEGDISAQLIAMRLHER